MISDVLRAWTDCSSHWLQQRRRLARNFARGRADRRHGRPSQAWRFMQTNFQRPLADAYQRGWKSAITKENR